MALPIFLIALSREVLIETVEADSAQVIEELRGVGVFIRAGLGQAAGRIMPDGTIARLV